MGAVSPYSQVKSILAQGFCIVNDFFLYFFRILDYNGRKRNRKEYTL